MKGIIRAGGNGTRLYPSTKAVNKHFFPVYDKPAIYYPVSLLIMTGVTEILLSVFRKDLSAYYELFGDGNRFGISIRYQPENRPMAVPETLLENSDFIGTDTVAVALGDNVFIGEQLSGTMRLAAKHFQKTKGATVFCKEVDDPRDYGVLEYDVDGRIRSLESKPQNPRSKYAVTGVFFFDATVFDTIKRTKPSENGSVNFGDMLRQYLSEGRLHSEILDEGIQWFDTGTPERLWQAGNAVRAFQNRHSVCAGSIEEAAFENGLIDKNRFLALSEEINTSEYGRRLEEHASVRFK